MPIFSEPPVIDMTAPSVLSFSPGNQTLGAAVGGNIVITFSEAVQRGSGLITVRTTAGAVVATCDVGTSCTLAVSGNALEVKPTNDHGIYTNYVVEIAAGAIKDLAGNSYAGESNYGFTTQTLDSLYHLMPAGHAAT